MSNCLKIMLLLVVMAACAGKKEQKKPFDISEPSAPKASTNNASTRVDLDSKGVGPIDSVHVPDEIDQALAQQAQDIYEDKCTLCHRLGETFIGPPPEGITQRRTPEWIMNMILNPEGMVEKDSLAMDLFMEFNGTPMTNQNLTKAQARAVLEYFRTID